MQSKEKSYAPKLNLQLVAIFAVVIVAVVMRFVPHWPNFTPIAAIALFGGAHFRNRLAALAVPLAAMVLSDFVLGFSAVTMWVYVSLAMIVGLGILIRRNRTPAVVLVSALSASIMFFLITNFGWWMSSSAYPKNFSGLMLCYGMAVPFFRYTLAGDLVYTTLFFGVYAFASQFAHTLRSGKVPLTSGHAAIRKLLA
jgi:hypothetical protein